MAGDADAVVSAEGSSERCGAKTRAGGRCRRRPVIGGKRCRMHGGRGLLGPANPNFKDGRYSVLMRQLGLGDAYERSRRDPTLHQVREELAVVDGRLSQLLRDLAEKRAEAPPWDKARVIALALRVAIQDGNAEEIRRQADSLDALTAHGLATLPDWAETYNVIELRRRLADTEAKTLDRLKATMTVEQALAHMQMVLAAVRKHVTDRATLAAIGADFAQIAGRAPAAVADVAE